MNKAQENQVPHKTFGVDLRIVLSTRTFVHIDSEDAAKDIAQDLALELRERRSARSFDTIHISSMETIRVFEAAELRNRQPARSHHLSV